MQSLTSVQADMLDAGQAADLCNVARPLLAQGCGASGQSLSLSYQQKH